MKLASNFRLLALGLVIAFAGGVASADSRSISADIVDTAVAAGSFTTLVTAIEAAGLVDTLKGTGPFTPTDAAFARLPAGTVEALLKDQKQLAKVLTYHVVAGTVMAADVKSGKDRPGPVPHPHDTGRRGVDNAMVVQADIVATNGVIHVIDTVVLPR